MKMCPWWIRWYHRRRRRLDEQVLIPRLVRSLAAMHHPEIAYREWAAHRRSAAHWQCRCAGAGLNEFEPLDREMDQCDKDWTVERAEIDRCYRLGQERVARRLGEVGS